MQQTFADPATAEEAVMLTMMTLGRRMRHRIAGDPVDFSAIPLLKTLAHLGPMRLSALASACELDASTVSRHARHLEDRGMLARTADPDDGRASRVQVSEPGLECLRVSAERRRQLVAEAIRDWSDADREQLRLLLGRLYLDLTNDPSEETA
jgi:DNA-binding MarR family transcriptional regulator